MAKNKYIIKYSEAFVNQFSKILDYLMHRLEKKIAAEKFYNDVITAIETRSNNPESFEVYKSSHQRKNKYYRIYVNNYIIFYVVNDNCMEIRRILYSRRNYTNLT